MLVVYWNQLGNFRKIYPWPGPILFKLILNPYSLTQMVLKASQVLVTGTEGWDLLLTWRLCDPRSPWYKPFSVCVTVESWVPWAWRVQRHQDNLLLLHEFSTAVPGHANTIAMKFSPNWRRKIFKFSNKSPTKAYDTICFSIFTGWSQPSAQFTLECFPFLLKEASYFKKN